MNTKEKIYNNIENLLKRSFEEGIEHFLQYVKQAIDEA